MPSRPQPIPSPPPLMGAPSVIASPSLEDAINEDPAAYFLSPPKMAYEYEDWAEDSDDDPDQIEWDAGITDFALFHDDRRQAHARQAPVSNRWQSLLANQASALQRATLRHRSDSDPISKHRTWTPLVDDLPHLTPDNSPPLHDNFDMDQYCRSNSTISIPSYLRSPFPPSEELSSDDDYEDDGDDDLSDSEDDDENDLPIAFLVERARERRRAARKMERPGLRFNRTMSGKVHVWRRPSYQLPDVGEEPEAERSAELASSTHVCMQ